MSMEALIILELYRRHMKAAQKDDEKLRARYLNLIKEMEWAFPEALQEIEEMYPVNK